MTKIAFIFPGQGAQYPGMARSIVENYASAAAVFDQATEALGFDVREMIFNGTDETLRITENTQPAIVTASIACAQPLLEKGIVPDVTAGLSLGEYCAHVISGSMGFSDAVALVRKRGKYMQEAVPLGVGAMAAIIGLDNQTVIDCCKEASHIGVVEPANFNCPGQVVVAGIKEAVEEAARLAKEKGAKRALMMPVSAPFHCSLLKPVGEKLAVELEKVQISEMKIPVLTNVTGDYIRDSSEIKDLLIRQVSTSVLWENIVRRMLADGVDTFVEIGPGKVLSGFVKRIDKEARTLNVEDMESLENTLKELNA